jgi:protein TonB
VEEPARDAARRRQPRAEHFIYALGASILVHAVLLVIRFRPFDPARIQDRTPPLEVALVNAKSKLKPAVADILAQSNLDGGGNTELPRRAKTPLPVLPKANATGEIAVASQRLDVLEQEARELMTRIQSASAAPSMPKPVERPSPWRCLRRASSCNARSNRCPPWARIAKDIENAAATSAFVGARPKSTSSRATSRIGVPSRPISSLNCPEAARSLSFTAACS